MENNVKTTRCKRTGGRAGFALLAVLCLGLVQAGCGDIGTYLGLSSPDSQQESEESDQQDQKKEQPASVTKQAADEAPPGEEKADDKPDQPAEESPERAELERREEADPQEQAPKRNPFAPVEGVNQQQQEVEEGEGGRKRTELEKYSLSALRLSAIISEVAVPKAMFIDPERVGHLAKEGDRIGENGGTIEDIRSNEVVISVPSGTEEEGDRKRVIQLREATRATSRESGLDEDERKMLDQLMRSKEGREALQESYRKVAPGAAASEQQRQQQRQQGTQEDQRFPGLAPPQQQ